MTTIKGRVHAVFPMGDATRVGEARRFAAQLAAQASLNETSAGRLALIVTELGNNLLRHAQEGRLLLAEGDGEVEVLAIDRGPGMADVPRHMGDGFSTGGTPGTGLGAVRRLAQDFDLHSVAGEGTIVLARVRATATPPASRFRIGGIATSAPGEFVCGDAWAAVADGDMATVVVADGLGHGTAAAEASLAMVGEFLRQPDAPLGALLESGHVQLRSTRGAAVAAVRLDGTNATCSSCGAGNVIGRVVSGASDRTVVTQHGTVGVQMRRPEPVKAAWPEHAIVVLHSDGMESRWGAQRLMPVLARDPLLAAAILWRDHCRGRDDATVVVVRRDD